MTNVESDAFEYSIQKSTTYIYSYFVENIQQSIFNLLIFDDRTDRVWSSVSNGGR